MLTTSRDDTPDEPAPDASSTPSPSSSAGPLDGLTDVTWHLRSLLIRRGDQINTKDVVPATLELSPDGTFTATTGCSDLSGSWEEAGSVVTTSGIEKTGGCDGDEQGEHLVRLLGEFTVDEQADILTLFGVGSAKRIGAIYSKE